MMINNDLEECKSQVDTIQHKDIQIDSLNENNKAEEIANPSQYEIQEDDNQDVKFLIEGTLLENQDIKDVTTDILVQAVNLNTKPALFKTLMEDYSNKKIGLAFLHLWAANFKTLSEDKRIEFFEWLYKVLSDHPYQQLNIIDRIIKIYCSIIVTQNKKSTDMDIFDVLVDITKYNCSDQAIDTCYTIIDTILKMKISGSTLSLVLEKLSENKKKEKNLEIKMLKSKYINNIIYKMNDILLQLQSMNRTKAVKDSFGTLKMLFKIIKLAEENQEIIIEEGLADKILENLAEIFMKFKESSNRNLKDSYKYFTDDYELSKLFNLLITFHSSLDLKDYLLKRSYMINFFSLDLINDLINGKIIQDDGVKEKCLNYLYDAYKNPEFEDKKITIRQCIYKFITTDIQSKKLRRNTFRDFLSIIEDQKVKSVFINDIIIKLFETVNVKNLYAKRCIICEENSFINPFDFATKIYRAMKESSNDDIIAKRNDIQSRLENKIFCNNTKILQEHREYFFELVTSLDKYEKDINQLVIYSKNIIDKIIKTQDTQITYKYLFSDKKFSAEELLKYELRLNNLFNKIDDKTRIEFADLKQLVEDNINDNIFNNIKEISKEKRDSFFDSQTKGKNNNEIIKYTESIMQRLIDTKVTDSYGCIFCNDRIDTEKTIDYLLGLYVVLDSDKNDYSDILGELRKPLQNLMIYIEDINKKRELFYNITKNLSIDEISSFSLETVDQLISVSE